MPKRKKVTIKDIAKELKLSPAAVSQALNHPREVGRQTVRRVLEKCKELGYIRRTSARKRKGAIGVIAQDIYNLILGEHYNYILEGVLAEAQKRKMRVEIEFVPHGETPLMISKNSVDGLLLFGKITKDLAMHLQQNEIPMVLVGHPIPHLEFNTVMADGRAGIYEIAKYLLSLGHRKIAMVYSKPLHDRITAERIEGYRFALTEQKVKLNEKYLAEANWCHPVSAVDATLKLLDLKTPPTAIIYANDTMAYRAYRAFAERKLKIPRDISVAGFDNMLMPNYIEPLKPDLTTVNVNQKLLGKTAVEVLLNVMEHPPEVALRYTLPVELMVKDSTGKAKD